MAELSHSGVIEIIRACKDSGVSRFKLGELELEFGASAAVSPAPLPPAPEAKPGFVPAPILSPEEQAQLDAERLKDLEAQAKQEFLSELRLEDPYAFEQLMQSGDLEAPKEP